MAGFRICAVPSASASAACRLVERHAVHTINVWITGQRSALLLLSQQSRHDPAGLFGGKDAPGGTASRRAVIRSRSRSCGSPVALLWAARVVITRAGGHGGTSRRPEPTAGLRKPSTIEAGHLDVTRKVESHSRSQGDRWYRRAPIRTAPINQLKRRIGTSSQAPAEVSPKPRQHAGGVETSDRVWASC
jgi:hypothetical protein